MEKLKKTPRQSWRLKPKSMMPNTTLSVSNQIHWSLVINDRHKDLHGPSWALVCHHRGWPHGPINAAKEAGISDFLLGLFRLLMIHWYSLMIVVGSLWFLAMVVATYLHRMLPSLMKFEWLLLPGASHFLSNSCRRRQEQYCWQLCDVPIQ